MSKIILDRLKEKFGADVLETSSFRGDEVALVSLARWREVAEFVRSDPRCACDYFVDLSVIDRCDPAVDELDMEDRFEVYVIAHSLAKKHRVRLKTRTSGADPRVPTLTLFCCRRNPSFRQFLAWPPKLREVGWNSLHARGS